MLDDELKILAKQCLSIVSTATLKDNEIEMWIKMAMADMKRLGIDVTNKLDDDLVIGAIMMYVKGNFGNTDIKEKELCQKAYILHVKEMSLSCEYRVGDSNE